MAAYRDKADQADTDVLTGAGTREALHTQVVEELERARRSGSPCSVHLFDIDYFNSVNEAFGNARGDEVLRELATRVNGLVRTGDTLFRYGGDEFVLLLPGTGKTAAMDAALRIIDAVRAAPFPGHPPLSLSVSLGVATFPDDAGDATALLEVVGRRSYLGKRRGRACAVGDDAVSTAVAPASSRLLEREEALHGAQEFLAALPEQRRGVLRVAGKPGAGHTRFLQEVRKVAQLRGFDTFDDPRAPWRRRLAAISTSASRRGGPSERPAAGALLILDEPGGEVDLGEVLAGVAAARDEAGVLGVVYVAPGAVDEPDSHGLPLSAQVELPPWSAAALRSWLSTTLQGEPSPALLDWLDSRGGGLPAEVERELNQLAAESELERTATGGWTLTAAALADIRARHSGDRRDEQARIAQRICQLPPTVLDFTGRELELVHLAETARQAAAGEFRSAAVATISGQPGVGKTTLAVHVAHSLAPYFPDGQWYIDLRGIDEKPLDPADALSRLLAALAVPADRIPGDLAERSALFRSLTYDRRLLVVLDNAAAEAQVRSLLPAGAGCVALVTSRKLLTGLEGVRRLTLDMLSPEGAVDLLAEIVGRPRVTAEVSAAFEAARLCGYLPLALRIAGNRLASRTTWTIGHLVEQLQDDQRRLELLTAGDLQVRSTFALSYSQLSPRARVAFRRLALAPGPDFDAGLAGALLDDPPQAVAVLDELVDACMIEPAPTPGRYRFHDLLRLYARDRLHDEEAPAATLESEGRLLGWLVDIATRAAAFADPAGEDSGGGAAAVHLGTATIATREGALRWLDLESSNWLGAVRRCAELGRHEEVVRLGHALHWYADVRSFRAAEWREVFALALDAARMLGDRRFEGIMLNYLAWTYSLKGPFEVATDLHRAAIEICREVGNRTEEGWALVYLGNCHRRCGEQDEAIGHYERAIRVFREIGYQTGEAIALTHLGESLREAGEYERSISYQEESLTISTRIGASISQAFASMRMGQALAAMGRWHEACGHYENAASGFQGDGPVRSEGIVLYLMGLAHQELGNLDTAASCLQQAVQIFTETYDRRQQAAALQALSSVTRDLSGHPAAASYEQQAQEILRQLHRPGPGSPR
jgi:diguanylate cyclase (GGDEF)-like protein